MTWVAWAAAFLMSMIPAQSGFARMPADPSVGAPAPSWIPFVSPMNVFHEYWFVLLIPMAIGVSWIYKAYRIPDLSHLVRETVIMTVQVIVGIVALAIVMSLCIEIVIPMLPAE